MVFGSQCLAQRCVRTHHTRLFEQRLFVPVVCATSKHRVKFVTSNEIVINIVSV